MKNLWKILTFVTGVKKYYLVIASLTVIISLISLAQPALTGLAIDEISKGTDARLSFALLLAFAIFMSDFLSNLLNNVNGYYGDVLGAKIGKFLGEKYYSKLLSLPKQYFNDTKTGQIINRLDRSSTEISNFITAMTNNFLQFIFGTLFALIAVALYSIEVALLLATLYPIYTWLTAKTSPKWQEWQKEKNEYQDIAKGRFNEAVAQIDAVKSYAQEKRELTFFTKNFQKVINLTKPQSRYWHKNDVLRRFALNIIFFAVFAMIFYQGSRGEISAGQAVALVLYANQIRIPIFTISFLVDRAQRAIADSADYFEVLNEAEELAVDTNREKLKVTDGVVEYKNVSFSYNGNEQVIKKASFVADRGQKIAFVGESGEGKSTLVNLLMGLYVPDYGQILIDGQDIATVSRDSLRKNIATVFQQPNLFSGTIAENISYANPKASQAQIVAAAKAANAHKFISDFKKGYKSEIGERGLKLSGGQQQRIAIARAILKDAPLLILDEATSSLDSKAEKEVQTALNNLMKGRTTFIIAHRLSTIEDVDSIIVLKNGRISEQGTPKELAGSGGLYSELLALQQQGPLTPEQAKKYDIS